MGNKFFIIAILILAVLLIPIPQQKKDGGSVVYNAILYSVEKVHKFNPDLESEYEFIEGTIVKILGIEVFNNVVEPLPSMDD